MNLTPSRGHLLRGFRSLLLLVFLSGGFSFWALYGVWRLGAWAVHHLRWVTA